MADFRELSPTEEVIHFAQGEFPATYGGPVSSPRGFRELSPDEEVLPLKAPKPPNILQRAVGAGKEALPPLPSVSLPSMETVKSYLPSFPGTRPAPTPKPPQLNPQFKVDDMGNVFDQASGKNILEQGPQAPQAPIIQPSPAPGLLSGITDRLKSLIPAAPSPQLPEGTQVAEMPDMGANIPSAKEPPPPLYGAAKVRAGLDAAKRQKTQGVSEMPDMGVNIPSAEGAGQRL